MQNRGRFLSAIILVATIFGATALHAQVEPPSVADVCIGPADGAYKLNEGKSNFSPTTTGGGGETLIGPRVNLTCRFERDDRIPPVLNQSISFVAKCPEGYVIVMPNFSHVGVGAFSDQTPVIHSMVTKILSNDREETALTFKPNNTSIMTEDLTVGALCGQP